MNNPTSPPVPPVPLGRRRAPLIGVLIASGALLVAACGSSPNNAAVAHLGSTTTTNVTGSQGVSPPATSNSSGPSAGGAPSGSHSQSVFAIPGGNGADALKFSECMRSHGVPNFPDPNAAGAIQASGLNPGSTSFQDATKSCRHLLPNGGVPTPAEQATALAQALKFSQCMRSHGITGFPDPQSVPGGGIRIAIRSGQGSNLTPTNPQFQAAQKACQSLTGGGPLGGPG
jgi:hypothetical protein